MEASAAIDADGIAVVLREGDLCRYVAEDAVGPLWGGRQFEAGSCVSGLAMRTGETIAIADTANDLRVPQDLYRDTFDAASRSRRSVDERRRRL